MNFKSLILFGVFFIPMFLNAQENYFKKVVKELTSEKYNGRGYTYNGMEKASEYLSKEFKKIGLKAENEKFLYPNEFPINIIHNATLVLNGKELKYGKDFIVKPSSTSVKKINNLDSYIFPINDFIESFKSESEIRKFVINDEVNQNGKNIILPPIDTKVDSIQKYYKQWSNTYDKNENQNRAVFRFVKDSLTASLSQKQSNISEFIIKEKFYSNSLMINDFSVETEFVTDFKFNNVIGFVEGENNDSVLVISAHYDHLGRVGDAIFPGASDNATGTAMVLDLAKNYVKNKPKYKTYFMLFGAEEAGIVGAYKYVDNPLFPLSSIKFLVNLDIMGAGEDGVQVVNGTKYRNEFNNLVKINSDNKFVKEIKIRGESCNSDHCPFDKKGVPSLFIYTLGGNGNYHNIYDNFQNIDFSNSTKVKSLLTTFINQL